MNYRFIGKSALRVSCVGLGGHYKAKEEGVYEASYGYVEREIAPRVKLVERALEAGINYFDTTWRNETAVLGAVLKQLGARDRAVVNGMVIGAFTGSKIAGLSAVEYFTRWLDARLPLMPDGHFNIFMVNAVEENYSEAELEQLLQVLLRRQAQGDLDIPGFSCHDVFLARRVAERFPEFEVIMTPYNFHNRRFEEAFDGYSGSANFVAMKAMVWLEYGIPFCAVNPLPAFRQNFGFDPAPDASTRALRFILANPLVTAAICSVNSPEELENVIQAGEGVYSEADSQLLAQYQQADLQDSSIPLYLGALKYDNLRMNYFGCLNLARALGIKMPAIPLNQDDSPELIRACAAELTQAARAAGYQRYL
jgi:aryl-alcohol dehydrogenase-like predicted oxidoreductase